MKRWEAINEIAEKPESLRSQALGIFAHSLLLAAGVDTESIVLNDLEETYQQIENWLNEAVITRDIVEERKQKYDQNNSR